LKESYNKEAIYDEKIAPLMHEILQICKAEELPMIATFYLKSEDGSEQDEGPMYCTSNILPKDNSPEHFYKLSELARCPQGKPYVTAFMIRKE
jgi:hypothetical protein